MGLLIKLFIIFIIISIAGGSYIVKNPEVSEGIIIGLINKAYPAEYRIQPSVIDIINKNPIVEENEAAKNEIVVYNKLFEDNKKSLLGKPKKIVEYLCKADSECKYYFRNELAICFADSGECYL